MRILERSHIKSFTLFQEVTMEKQRMGQINSIRKLHNFSHLSDSILQSVVCPSVQWRACAQQVFNISVLNFDLCLYHLYLTISISITISVSMCISKVKLPIVWQSLLVFIVIALVLSIKFQKICSALAASELNWRVEMTVKCRTQKRCV